MSPLLAPAQHRLALIPWASLVPFTASIDPALSAILSGQPAERVVDRFLRQHRRATPDERTACVEALFGVGLWRRRLRATLAPALPAPTPLQLLGSLLRDLARLPHPQVDELLALLNINLPPPTPLTDFRDLTSIPDWLADVFLELAPDSAPQLAAAFTVPGPITLRANTLRTSRDELRHLLAERGVTASPTRWARDGLHVASSRTRPRSRPNLLGLGLNGLFEVQDEASQLLAELVQAQPGDTVLDLCAGAGGKSLALAAHVGPSGRVHATDVDLPRLDRLRQRAVHAHATITLHGARPPPELRFRRVLVDAPCSELGALRRGPDLRWRIDPATFSALPGLQLELLETGLRHLAPDGRLVYATCTLRHAENQAVVSLALDRHPGLRLFPPPPQSPQFQDFTHHGSFLSRPDLHGTDGFFAACVGFT